MATSAISFRQRKNDFAAKGVRRRTGQRFFLDSRCAIKALFIRFNNQAGAGLTSYPAEVSVRK
jgi:hypothetical protein